MTLLLRLQRKDALIQLTNDLLRHNSFFGNDISVNSYPKYFSPISRSHEQKHLGISSLSSNSINFYKTLRTFSSQPLLSTSDQTYVNYDELSTLDRNLISNKIKLQNKFINKNCIEFSKDGNKIVFNFYGFRNPKNKLEKIPLEFSIKNDAHEGIKIVFSEESSFKAEQNFHFFSFDKNLIELLEKGSSKKFEKNLNEDESIVIFDDPLNASLFHQETGHPVIVFRFGLSENSLIGEICHQLNAAYQKIFLWTQNVDFARDFRSLCLKYFDQFKIFRITEEKSVLEFCDSKFYQKDMFLNVLRRSFMINRPGVIHANQTGDELFKFLNDPCLKGTQWTRFIRLNEQLKGHRPGELTIITGPTGSGKTTFVSEYSLDLCVQGVPTLWGSFELKYMSLEKIMMTQLVGRQFDFSNKKEFCDVFDEFSRLPLYFLNFHGQTDVEIVLKEAKHAVLMKGIEHLVIDNLQFMLGLSQESSNDRFYKQDYVLGMIRQFATEYRCHVTLVAHPRKEKEEFELSNNSLYGGVKASQEADNIMIVMNKYNPRYRCNKYIQITKNRAYGNLGVVPLYFDKNSQCFSANTTVPT